ncbi:MAG: helix-turn-helix transcriptional regulator [Candidatus Latescibacterota bacterium]
MPEYLTTREVAQYLRLNEKKVYDLVSRGQLPAARVSGKWLFPRHLVDEWVAHHTLHPSTGLLGAVLDELIVVQGSDDWLLCRAAERFQSEHATPVVSTPVGSLAGLAAVGAGRAHLAGCHVGNEQVASSLGSGEVYLFTLCQRAQGLIVDRGRHPQVDGLESLGGRRLRFADRQPQSGTYQLVRRLLAAAGVAAEELDARGPYSSHLEVALAVRQGEADVGIGTQLAARMCGLDFVELATEPFKLAVPLAFASHPRLAAFLEFVLAAMRQAGTSGLSGYRFDELGRVETVSGVPASRVPAGPRWYNP